MRFSKEAAFCSRDLSLPLPMTPKGAGRGAYRRPAYFAGKRGAWITTTSYVYIMEAVRSFAP
jgi:hypothetical protein